MEWISVNDTIPANEKTVLVADDIYHSGDCNGESFTPICWMLLPEIPSESPFYVECNDCNNVSIVFYKDLNDWKCGYRNPLKEK